MFIARKSNFSAL